MVTGVTLPMVTSTSCVTLVSACIMPSHTCRGKVSRPRRGQIEDMRPCVRPKVGLGTDCPGVRLCHVCSSLLSPVPVRRSLLARPVCDGRTGAARTSRPGLTLLPSLYQSSARGNKDSDKRGAIALSLSMNNGMLRSVSKMSCTQFRSAMELDLKMMSQSDRRLFL